VHWEAYCCAVSIPASGPQLSPNYGGKGDDKDEVDDGLRDESLIENAQVHSNSTDYVG